MNAHWNLPDGCTPTDIDLAAGAVYRCRCGRIVDSDKECPRCSRDPDVLRDQQQDEKATK
jgi:hypothetical protein